MTNKPMTTSPIDRKKHGEQRSGTTTKVQVAGWDLYVTVNFYDNDQPGEVFVTMGKNGSTLSGLMQCVATQFSMMLQAGLTAEKITSQMRHHRFEPRDDRFDSLVDALASTVLKVCSERGSKVHLDHSERKLIW